MKKLISLLLMLTPILTWAQLNGSILLSGRVTAENGQPLPNASVQVKGTTHGTTADSLGNFSLVIAQKFPFTIVISSVGYAEQEITVKNQNAKLAIQLSSQTMIANEVVISASRQSEKLLRSPISIEKLDIRALKETPSPTFYDALGNMKGIQLTTSSLTFKVPNARGFNIPNNFRFMQLVDGVDMQAATLGVPLGNAIGPTDLDIQTVEVIPGAASALYGMNAINGLATLTTKSPFVHQGLSLYAKGGVNHVDGIDHNPSLLQEYAIRYAKAFNDKFAFKVNFDYLHGTDWVSNNATDQNPNNLNTANPSFPELNGAANNPAYDAWNRYGDENNNAVTINGVDYQGKKQTFILRRTGYWEKDLVHPDVSNIKFDGSLYYKFNKNTELSYGYRIGKLDGIFQRGNKIQMDNVQVQNHKLELKGEHFMLRTYMLIESTGNSYNLKPLADNLDLNNGTNNQWGAKFKTALQTALNDSVDLATAMQIARTAADKGRVEPGTAAFNALKDSIIHINNWDIGSVIAGAPKTGGAWLKQQSHTYQFEGQWDLTEHVKVFNLLVGADARIYEVIPDGNNFVDFSRPVKDRNTPLPDGSFGKNVYYKKFGGFAQVTKTFFQERLKLFGSLRYDYNPEFEGKWNPRIAAVYTVSEKHNFRFSFQNGFRFPALFEALSFVNNGNVRRVGGLDFINEGLGYLDNSYTLASVNSFNAAVNKDVTNGMNQNDAALKNRDLLTVTNLPATRPERVNSFEIGYKAVLFDNKIFIDWDAYHNVYDGFLGQVEVSVPSRGPVGSDSAVIDMLASNRSKQTRYRVFTNAKNKYTTYGSSLGITYNFYKKYSVSGNVSFNTIEANETSDVFVTGFNTPKYAVNLAFGNREIVKNFGFNIVWRWQDSYLWESTLATGTVPAYQTIDAQVTYRAPTIKSTFKLGGSNILNTRYYQYAAGPTIGGLYYLAVTVDGLFSGK